jgi:hypothetical protein
MESGAETRYIASVQELVFVRGVYISYGIRLQYPTFLWRLKPQLYKRRRSRPGRASPPARTSRISTILKPDLVSAIAEETFLSTPDVLVLTTFNRNTPIKISHQFG